MKCRPKDEFEVIILSKETVQYTLDKLGFREENCSLYALDELGHKKEDCEEGRYAFITNKGIECGFKGWEHGEYNFGGYFVDGYDGWDFYYNKEEFEKYYEII